MKGSGTNMRTAYSMFASCSLSATIRRVSWLITHEMYLHCRIRVASKVLKASAKLGPKVEKEKKMFFTTTATLVARLSRKRPQISLLQGMNHKHERGHSHAGR